MPAIAAMRVQHPVDMSPYRENYTNGQMLGNTLCAIEPASLLYHPRFETTPSSGVKAYHDGGPPLVITSQATRPDQIRPCDQPHFLCMVAICIGHQIRLVSPFFVSWGLGCCRVSADHDHLYVRVPRPKKVSDRAPISERLALDNNKSPS